MVYPKYILKKNICDFCNNKSEQLYEKLLSYSFGFVTCEKCNKIAEQSLINWIQKNNKISWLYFLILLNIDVNIEEDTFTIKRTNGHLEHDWFVNVNSWIVYNNNFLLPMVKYDDKYKFLFKKIDLEEFCKYNNTFDLEKCKSILKRWISISQ